jgi:hypothetical protein
MSKDLTTRSGLVKRPSRFKPERQQATGAPSRDAASRLKRELMADALGRTFGEDGEKPDLAGRRTGTPRVILALANHGRSPGWDRAKALQRQLFTAAAAAADQRPGTNCVGNSAERATASNNGLEMKFAFYGPDDSAGVRRCRITTRWITDPSDMAGTIDRAECDCGCYIHIRSVLAQATKEAEARPLRAVLIVGDAFHDNQDGLDEAAICANQLRKMGTRVFLIQLGENPDTARKLQYLARVSGGAYFRFDPRTQDQQFAEMFEAVSASIAGGEEAVMAKGGQEATLLLEHLKQTPLPTLMPTREQTPALQRKAASSPASRS